MSRPINLLWIDTETTGLSARKNGLVSIAALANWNTDGNFYREIRPFAEAELEPKAMEVNGFTREQVFDPARPSEVQVANEFNAWVKASFSGPPIICGQNVRFDMDFINAMFRRHNVYLGLHTRALDIQGAALYLHSVGLIELPFKGDCVLTNLDVLLDIFLPEQKRQSTQTHSAFEDIWLTRNVFWAMQRKVAEMGERLARIGDLSEKLLQTPVLTGEQLAMDFA